MYKCRRENCEKTFTQDNNRSRHQKKCNKGIVIDVVKEKKSLVCPNEWCRKEFNKGFNLSRHLSNCKVKTKVVHSCPVLHCGKTFISASKLKRHESTHEPRPVYTCSSCKRTYGRKDKYNLHVKKCELFIDNIGYESKSISSFDGIDEDESHGLDTGSDEDNDYSFNRNVVDSYGLNAVNCNEESSYGFGNDRNVVNNYGLNVCINGDSGNCLSFDENYVSNVNEIDEDNIYGRNNGVDEENSNDLSSSRNDFQAHSSSVEFQDTTHTDYSHISFSLDRFESELSQSTLAFLKALKHESKRSHKKAKKLAEILTSMFKKKFDNSDFMILLATKIGFSSEVDLMEFINNEKEEDTAVIKPGRPLTNVVERQLAYDFWLSVSDLSNDRRNARHMVKIRRSKLDLAVADLCDSNITTYKNVSKLKAQKRVYSHPIRTLYKMFKVRHTQSNISPSLFFRCKPFYITLATTREMESCLCQKCLNPHVLFNAVQRHLGNTPLSLTDYLTSYFECERDIDIGYPTIDCIEGMCDKGCSITNENDQSFEWTKHVIFYQFESVTETYFNKNGKMTQYQRVARQDYKDVTLREAYKLLMKQAREYLHHRYNILVDKVFWQQHLETTDIPVVWMDYSQNIRITEKNQVQSAHFSGRQQTLHDSLIQIGQDYQYIYHLSDDTNHDSIMTNEIIMSNISNYPAIIASGRLQLRSDNCSTQYKSRFVFHNLLCLAERYRIQIDWFFGEPGHGRGLIDAMAWFGCKGPLRKEIITNDTWFSNAKEMVNFLKKKHENDPKKQYYYIGDETTAEKRKKTRNARKLAGCKKAHVISFYPDGQTIKMWVTIREFLRNEIELNQKINEEEEEDDIDLFDNVEGPVCSETPSVALHDLIEINSFVVIRSPPDSLELFHLMKVTDKGRAEEDIVDISGEHAVLKGEPYLIGVWFSFQMEMKRYAQYREAKNTEKALIHVGEVLTINVELDENQRMDIAEYRILACNTV